MQRERYLSHRLEGVVVGWVERIVPESGRRETCSSGYGVLNNEREGVLVP